MLQCALEVDMLVEHGARVFGVSARDVRAIFHVALAGPMSASRLADRLLVTRGAMTAILRRLGDGGWLDVQPDPNDRRCLIVSSTERSDRLIARWREQFSAVFDESLRGGPGPAFAHEFAAAVSVLAMQREAVCRLGPAELRELSRS